VKWHYILLKLKLNKNVDTLMKQLNKRVEIDIQVLWHEMVYFGWDYIDVWYGFACWVKVYLKFLGMLLQLPNRNIIL